MRDAAGVGYADYFEHAGHRFVLAGEKARAPQRHRGAEA
jgi:hypothetical protein